MRVIHGLEEPSGSLRWPVVTVGTFDGVHLGHQRVLSEAIRWARTVSGTAVVVTFEQPPRSLLARENAPLITSVPHRLMLLERLGLDVSLLLRFTPELACTSALDFVRRVFVEAIGARGVVLGHDCAFGRNREGNEELLRRHQADLGFEVRSVDAVMVDGEVVSSTRVRGAVLNGDFTLAGRLLGRVFSVFGTVVHGHGRGRGLGFPTANLDLHNEVTPPDGVYVARAAFGGETRPALASIGTQATFAAGVKPPARRVIEIHLLDFDREIYDRDVEVQFLGRLRAQKRFSRPDELIRQMGRDVNDAREYFAGR
jgi:riboflavin kinase/FMN adenylyltransferase